MSNCQPHIAIHHLPGSKQTNRFLEALRIDYVKLDEREIGDLIIAANSLSERINYYNGNNEVIGLWQSFFQWEPISILAQISVFDINRINSDFKIIKRELLFLQTNDERKIVIKDFLEVLNKDVQDLYNKIEYLPTEIDIKEYFESTYRKIEALLNLLITKVENDDKDDVLFLLQHHLFNQQLHNLLGLISDWVSKSKVQFEILLSSYASNSPQYALFLTFLKLFKHAQDDLNSFTKRHLDFYYKDLLQLRPNKGISDYVHCIVEPHQDTLPFAIEKGAAFIAGKDQEGRAKFYSATTDTTINQIKIDSVYSGFKKDNRYFFQNLIDKNASGESFHAFTTEVTEQIGLILASPLFFLRGGKRTIRLKFLKDGNEKAIVEGRYLFYLSGAEEWLQVEETMDDNIVELVLKEEVPAIIPFDNEIHEGAPINTTFPVLKIVSADGQLMDPGSISIEVEIDVINYKQFNLYSDTGSIDHTKQFQPFGPIPTVGRSIIFSCNEFFQKNGASGTFTIDTDNTGWKFLDGTETLLYTNGIWESKSDNPLLISDPIVPEFSENRPLTKTDSSGFLKFKLSDTVKYDVNTYLEEFINQAKTVPAAVLPYIPTIDKFSFEYNVSFTSESIDFFQLHPKGTEKLNLDEFKIVQTIENDGELFIGLANVEPGNSVSLLFQVAEGTANPRQRSVELKWSYLDGDRWKYFENNPVEDSSNGLTQSGLVQIKVPEVLDLTNQTILPPGLWWIKIEVPERVDAICQLVGIHSQALKAKLFDFEETGLEFEENIDGNTITKLFRPKNQIKKIEQPYPSFGGKVKESDNIYYMRTSERLRHKDRAITKWDYEKLILDNFPSVYRVKCLNHYRYEAESDINDLLIHNNSAGYVTIIPVSKGISENVPVYWKPLVDLGTMKRIKEFLEEKCSPHVRIHVKPPKLEKLDINFNVRYKDIPGADSQLFTQRLKDVINAYLSPWAYKTDDQFKFQSEIEKSELIHLIESQSYVDYLSEFKVDHILLKDTSIDEESTQYDVDKIIPSTPYSLFIPNDHTVLTIIETCCV